MIATFKIFCLLQLERIEFQNEAKTRILHQMSLLGLEPLSPFEQKFLSNDEPETLKDDDINKIKVSVTHFSNIISTLV